MEKPSNKHLVYFHFTKNLTMFDNESPSK